MAVLNPYQQYQQTQAQKILNAEPAQLTLMLYDGAVKFIKKSILAIEKKRIEDAHNYIKRTQNIILYLYETLNDNYEISRNFRSIYDYLYRCLLKANTKKDPAIMQEVLELIVELRDAWEEAYRQNKEKN